MHRIPKWQPDIAYTSGNVVCYQGAIWTAIRWNQNEVPGGPAGAWKQNFNDAWQRNIAYTAHSVVTYNGHWWSAKEWNQNQVPGGPSGVWIDLGPV
ncbi:unnamed protein product [Rhizoctonia solani]|uniref:Carbohydrate-binding domain protein n=1 Tax=Rhizoctonia solani TaxID=456999 RepID=A0A8H7H2Q0_9AGAM